MTALEEPGGRRVIRELVDGDVAAVVAVERAVLPPEFFVTEAGFRHELHSWPARARRRTWVAAEDGEIVAAADAYFRWTRADTGEAKLWIFVRPDRRGGGLGRELFETAAAHLVDGGATALYSETFADAAGERFLSTRGFEVVSREHFSMIEPARADLSALGPLEAARRAEGFVLRPLGEVRDRPRELWELDTDASLDVPADTPRARMPYEEWLAETLDDPDLDDDGSFVVVHGDRLAAYSLLAVDREQRRAVHEMTGTAAEFRRRGLARLVKLAVLRRARETGIRSIWTGNDAENEGMLALNEELGYRHFVSGADWRKRL